MVKDIIPNNAIRITILNREFSSIADAAKFFNIPYSTLYNYLKKYKDNKTPDQIVLDYLNHYNKLTKYKGIIFHGKTFNSLKECCLKNNISYSSINIYLSKFPEKNIQEILEYGYTHKLKRENKLMPIEYEGVKYKSIAECCRALNIDKEIIYNKVRNKYNSNSSDNYLKEIKILDDKVNRGIIYNPRQIVYNNQLFASLNKLCLYYKIDRSRLLKYKETNQCSLEEAITYCINNPAQRSIKYVVDGIEYTTILDVAKVLGVHYNTIQRACKKNKEKYNMSYQETINQYVEKYKGRKKRG